MFKIKDDYIYSLFKIKVDYNSHKIKYFTSRLKREKWKFSLLKAEMRLL